MKPTADATQGRLRGILDQSDFGTPGAELTGAAMRVLESRYLLRNARGEVVETPRELFFRVANAIAGIESKWTRDGGAEAKRETIEVWSHKFFELMSTLRFLPNSPTLMNAGKPKGQLSACFVLPIEDDLSEVFETLHDAAIIHKTGGGTGFSFGRLRPAGDIVRSSGGIASGPVAFLQIFDAATRIIKQGGTRRGANMAILPVEHPDIERFIECKLKGGIENFNISVGISDAFMKSVKTGASWSLRNPRTGEIVSSLKAKSLWRKIAECAWASGDPGVVFLDRVNSANPTPSLGKMESTNPCGEQPLLPFESCNLGSINLVPYIQGSDLNWVELERDIRVAVRFLDNVIEANYYPLLEIEEVTLTNRKIGLGVMGWADALMEWGIAYDCDLAVARADEVMEKINRIAISASETLAAERGAFPGFSKSKWALQGARPRRNATVTTVAPTGTISIIAGVSSGIEPVFSLAYEREALEGEKMIFIHPALKKALRRSNVRSRRLLLRIVETGSIGSLDELPASVRRCLRTAHEIKPIWHIRMQAAFQRHTENGVSKTINLPHSASPAVIQKVFHEAYRLGCKGITVYRDASKESQVLRRGLPDRKGKRRDLLTAIDWLLDDSADEGLARKKASIGMASLSRAHLRQNTK